MSEIKRRRRAAAQESSKDRFGPIAATSQRGRLLACRGVLMILVLIPFVCAAWIGIQQGQSILYASGFSALLLLIWWCGGWVGGLLLYILHTLSLFLYRALWLGLSDEEYFRTDYSAKLWGWSLEHSAVYASHLILYFVLLFACAVEILPYT